LIDRRWSPQTVGNMRVVPPFDGLTAVLGYPFGRVISKGFVALGGRAACRAC